MTHKFDASNKHKLDSTWRREQMPPYPTLLKLGLVEGNTAADIGCGAGYFTLAMAEIVGQKSKVYALDISMEMLDEVERKAAENNLTNIRTIRVDEYDLKLEDGSVDFALLCNVLHEIQEKERYIQEVRRILAPGGKLAIIEWVKARTEHGPPEDHRIHSDMVETLFDNQLTIVDKFDIGTEFYAVIGRVQ